LLALGWSYAEVGRIMGITESTVSTYRANASNKLGSGTLVDMLRVVGWLNVPDS